MTVAIRDSNRPMRCPPTAHRSVDRILRKASSRMEYDCECLTCFATWTESEWVG